MIESAYNEVPYYNNLYNELDFDFFDLTNFEQLPIITKEEIKKYGIVNFISGIYAEHIREAGQNKNHRIEFTSGTTSEPIEILWDNGEYFASVRHHWNERRKYGILPDSRVLRAKEFKGEAARKPYETENNIIYYNLKIHQEHEFRELIQGINQFQPEWICMTASRIYLLLRLAEK